MSFANKFKKMGTHIAKVSMTLLPGGSLVQGAAQEAIDELSNNIPEGYPDFCEIPSVKNFLDDPKIADETKEHIFQVCTDIVEEAASEKDIDINQFDVDQYVNKIVGEHKEYMNEEDVPIVKRMLADFLSEANRSAVGNPESLVRLFKQGAENSSNQDKQITKLQRENESRKKSIATISNKVENMEYRLGAIQIARSVYDHALVYKNAWKDKLFLEDGGTNSKKLKDMHQPLNYKTPEYRDMRGHTGTPFAEEYEITYSGERSDIGDYLACKIKERKLCLVFGLPGIGKSTLFTWLLNQKEIGHDDENGNNKVYLKEDDILLFRFDDFENCFKGEEDADRVIQQFWGSLGDEVKNINNKLILLDGFDEIECKDGIREKFLCGLRKKIDKTCSCIVTCRQNYIQNLRMIKDIPWIQLCPFTEGQISEYIANYHPNPISDPLKKILLLPENREVFGLPVVLYMTLAVLADHEKEEFEGKITRFDVYEHIFRIEGGIYDRMQWAIKEQNNSVDAEKMHRTSENLAIWMFSHGRTDCPRNEAEQVINETENSDPSLLSAGFFQLQYLDFSGKTGEEENKTPAWKEVRFVHKSIYEYFAAKRILEVIDDLLCPDKSEEIRIQSARKNLGIILMTGNLQKEKEIADFLNQAVHRDNKGKAIKDNDGNVRPVIGADCLDLLTKCFGNMLVNGMIDYNDSKFYRYESYRSLTFWQREQLEWNCFRNMLFLLQIARKKSKENIIIPLNTQETAVREGMERYLRLRKKGEYIESDLLNWIDLSGCCFDRMDLSGYNLFHSKIDGCSFRHTEMEGTVFDLSPKKWNPEYFTGSNLLMKNAKTAAAFAKYDAGIYPGKLIAFGHYPYTKEEAAGDRSQWSPILWRVLDIEGGEALLLSERLLEQRQYHIKHCSITWAESELCRWLNDDFLKKAFDPSEAGMIKGKTVRAEKNPYYSTSPGADISAESEHSKVFLLNIQETCHYFGKDGYENAGGDRKTMLGGTQAAAYPVPYTWEIRKAEPGDDGTLKPQWWWLRSSGSDGTCAACVYSDGIIDQAGYSVLNGNGWVRPALWLKI